MSLPLNQPVTLTFQTYSDSTQTTLADATTVTVDILDPTGVTTTYTLTGAQVVHVSTGTYTLTYTPATAGRYQFHWHSTGTVATALDGSFTVDAEYTNTTVSLTDFATYLENDTLDTTRARFILDKAQQLCETIVNPLPAGADVVILDVAERAYANPTAVRGADLGLYSEGVGPYSTTTPGTVGGGLWLTENNKQTLRRLAGKGGAFTIDTIPATFTPSGQPWWDSGVYWPTSEFDTPS